MERKQAETDVPQNIGLTDRLFRMFIGAALLGGAFASMSIVWAVDGSMMNLNSWEPFAMLISVYPLLTAWLGIDPIYSLLGIRSCSPEECGTLPYEVSAAVKGSAAVQGDKPKPKSSYDHSL